MSFARCENTPTATAPAAINAHPMAVRPSADRSPMASDRRRPSAEPGKAPHRPRASITIVTGNRLGTAIGVSATKRTRPSGKPAATAIP